MDGDVGRRKNVSSLLRITIFYIIIAILYIRSEINKSYTYIIGNKYVYDLLKDILFNNGYYIKNEKRYIYKIYPIMY